MIPSDHIAIDNNIAWLFVGRGHMFLPTGLPPDIYHWRYLNRPCNLHDNADDIICSYCDGYDRETLEIEVESLETILRVHVLDVLRVFSPPAQEVPLQVKSWIWCDHESDVHYEIINNNLYHTDIVLPPTVQRKMSVVKLLIH